LDVGKVGQVIDEFKKNAGDLIPDKVQIQQIKESAEELGSVLKEKWDQLDIKEEKKKVDKLAKTIIKALNKAKDAISEEFAPDKELWSQRLQRIQQGFQSKWDEVTNKFLHDEEKFKTCDSKKPNSRKNSNFRKDNQKKQRAKPSSGKRQETIKINEKKNYTSWSSSSSAMAHKNASWIFSRAKNRDESRKETVKSDWLFDRASSRKRFHDLNKAEWYNRKVYGKHCDESGDCETIDYEIHNNKKNLKIKTSNKKPTSSNKAKRGETEHLNQGQEFVFVPNHDQKENKMDWSSKIGKLDERFIREASGTKRKLRSFDLIRDSEDDDDDSDENEEEFEEHAFKYVQRGGGRFGGTKKRPHLETSKNFRGGSPHQAEMKKSKKAEKRGRFHHWHNNQNHQRKDFLADQVVHFTQHHNKFH